MVPETLPRFVPENLRLPRAEAEVPRNTTEPRRSCREKLPARRNPVGETLKPTVAPAFAGDGAVKYQ